MTTFAPFARHWSACVFCFWALPSAFVITYETLAFLNAATSAGRSCVSQRTDDFGSGSSTQMSALPPVCLVGFATAAVTVTLTANAAMHERNDEFPHDRFPPSPFGFQNRTGTSSPASEPATKLNAAAGPSQPGVGVLAERRNMGRR